MKLKTLTNFEVQNLTTPQDAFESMMRARETGIESFGITALLANISVKHHVVASSLNQFLQGSEHIPESLAAELSRRFDESETEFKKLMTPIISVIIPYHNRESIIEKCIDSVLNQTIKNIEIIAVDDGSTDQSRNIVSSINDKRIIRINCDIASGNSGTPRNKALATAKGKYIAFVDSDDTIDPEYFEQLLNEAQKEDSEVTIAKGFRKCFKDNQGLPKQTRINYIYLPAFTTHKNKDYFFVNSFVIWDKLYKRSFLEQYDIKLADSKIGADTLMVAKTYFHATKIVLCNNEACYNYNAFSEGSVTQAFRSKGDIREEDRPYAQVFEWLTGDNVPAAYRILQWVRRLMSLSYCISSSKVDLDHDSLTYLDATLRDAPFKTVLTLLKRRKLNEQYNNISNLLIKLGRKPVHID
ncbi:glycosyltransferase family 2 protein [Pseudomonas fulva]|uniref:glycosyltransferase family 2 protein n=1 Tax=Pseudomonas fulva TaxID=47880 RepID=UPI0015E290EB|nr:glycosyltransferase family 2 protein [Pseudomonas fulva]MBA1207525.1 glycosyltransferase family 2 protein [Pseudomonas fulva]